MTEEKGEKKEEIQRIKKKDTRRKHRKETLGVGGKRPVMNILSNLKHNT